MLTLRLPDGSIKQVQEGSTPRDIAESIGRRLAQAAIAAKVDSVILDLDREIPPSDKEIPFQILTEKERDSLDVLRHSSAHVMA
ncbi:MAG: TGS domain-containing protein, partial [Planctomycetota bacterium]